MKSLTNFQILLQIGGYLEFLIASYSEKLGLIAIGSFKANWSLGTRLQYV